MSHKNTENTVLWSTINAFHKIGFTVFEIPQTFTTKKKKKTVT